MLLGIDLGTSMTKAAAFDLDGTCLAVSSRKPTLRHLGKGRIEQDFEDVVRLVSEVVREVVADAGRVPEAIGITGQSDGLWLLDENARPVRPAISWLDNRGSPYLQDWMDSGVYEEVFRRNGNAIFPGSHAPFMAALAQEDPGALTRAATASYLKDGILQRLTGARVTDASDASLPFLDTRTRDYDPEILELLGLSDCARLLAPVMPAPGQAFPLSAEGARLTGLPEGVPVHAGPFDIVACAVGAGVDQVGDGLVIIGTTLACEVLVDRVDTGGEPVGMTLCMPQEGRWMRALPATVGTASLDWILDLVGAECTQVEALLAQSRPGANGVTALPYFSATGERAPFADVRARGQLCGLNTGTSKGDMVMAICESVAYAARHCVEAAGLSGRLSVSGGGANSATWSQMIADVLQCPLAIAPKPEVGARGACLAAADAIGIDCDRAAWTKAEGVIEPRAELRDHYQSGFAHYLETVEAARRLWHSPEKERLGTASHPPLVSA
ncbi:xylulokinase/erythritol kinase [Paracoccus isoporae]|uniref:Xylulokinase/erythritol kinase n=1 Tax=Paracoccus isoporae TaxID=591205 RepID=A0A1G7H344_9RHOB|nr:FGGY-family carbohydrate kinase [Paracoccus isoporae]SDE94775.1 xylulokinase/erythritol kinase [Paracoccus isoporae]